jgi:hypothetical protein
MWRRAMPAHLEGEEADAAARAMALHVAARALDPRDVTRALDDPALRIAFGVDRPRRLLRRARGCVSAKHAAERLLVEFASRVPGLAGSSPRYLRRMALSLGATVEREAGVTRARLGRAPLDVLLVIAGCKRGVVELPGGVAVELLEDRGP